MQHQRCCQHEIAPHQPFLGPYAGLYTPGSAAEPGPASLSLEMQLTLETEAYRTAMLLESCKWEFGLQL